MKNKKVKKKIYGAKVKVEIEFQELGPDDMFTLHQQVGEDKERGIEILQSINGMHICFDFKKEIVFPKSSFSKNRRVIVSLSQIGSAVLQYVDQFKKPPIQEPRP